MIAFFVKRLAWHISVSGFMLVWIGVPLQYSYATEKKVEEVETNIIVDKKAVEFGKRIYRQGLLSSGEPLSGFVQGDIPIQGAQLACVNCHRRSGFGTSEGKVVIPPITAEVLFTPMTSRASELFRLRNAEKKTRPAYQNDSLAQAIRQGINPDKRPLDKLMPHYVLSDIDMGYLVAYLRSISSAASPGVSPTVIHLATIFSKDVPKSQKRATLRVLYRFIKDLNTDTRPHTRRAEHAPWHKKWQYESHRIWNLHVWEVEGPRDTWRKQLELQYGRAPVFALLGGVGEGDWAPVHQFCEEYELPCLFPNVNLPVVNENDFYSIYFSKGIVLEAEVLAKYLGDTSNEKQNIRIGQVYTDNALGNVASKLFKSKLKDHGFGNVTDIVVTENKALLQEQMLKAKADELDVLVFWTKKDDLKTYYSEIVKQANQAVVYVPASIFNTVGVKLAASVSFLKAGTHLIYPFDTPDKLGANMKKTQMWMNKRGVPFVEENLQTNTLFTITLASRVIKHLGSNFSRDYMIEKIEHLDKNIALTPIYPVLSLGPDQRFASKGGYIAEVTQAKQNESTIKIVSDWIVP